MCDSRAVTSGLRERKKAATRHRLHEAALRLVADRGLDAVSVDDIAEAAEVSPRTFFNYFPTKDDAVIGLDPTRPDELAEAFADRPAGEPPVASLRAVLRARAAEMAVDADIWSLRLPVIDGNPVLATRLAAHFTASENALTAAIAARTGTTAGLDVYPSLLAAVQGVVMRVSLHRWLTGGFGRALPELVDEAWDVIAAGLAGPGA